MNWGGLNNALAAWRTGLNTLFPERSTRSDGGRADSNHASTSQHQPDADGTVDAFDEDRNYLGSSDQDGNTAEDRIKAALDADFMADPRWQLIISDRKIRNPDILRGAARDYSGDSPHTEHTHRQVRQSLEDDGRPWRFTRTRALLRQMVEESMPSLEEIRTVVREEVAALFAVGTQAGGGGQTSKIGRDALNQGIPNPLEGDGAGKTPAYDVLRDTAAGVKVLLERTAPADPA